MSQENAQTARMKATRGRIMSNWFFGSKPWWRFWDPRSSFAGGVMLGLILVAVMLMAIELMS